MSDSTQLIHARAGSLLRQMAGFQEAHGEHAGDVIGPYELITTLGEGGFGTVWHARQHEPVRREVALKLIKLGMDTMQVLGRFDQERQALASLDHPCIATLLEAGVGPGGRPFFAMELIQGEPITEWAAHHASPLSDRLRLFILVCQAVQHAHQKGLIHRDLKPTNILVTTVDGVPTPKVIDFGIAKALHADSSAATLLTLMDQTIGTPHYMSPEQLAGERSVDTRSDIYALGVVLYEMLTGKPPFTRSTTLEQLKRKVRETQAIAPSRAASTPASDLDWITLRALEHEPARRYGTAADLAADVQRYLDDEPILARPPNLAYVSSRWIKRHRTAFIAACIVVLTLLSATIISVREARLARASEARATIHEAEAKSEAQRARQSADFLTGLLMRAGEEIKHGRNPEALRHALEGSAERIEALGDDHALRLTLLEQLSVIYQHIGETKAMIPLLKLRAGEALALHGPHSAEARGAELFYLRQVTDHGARATAPAMFEDFKRRVEAAGDRGSEFWFDLQLQLLRSYVKLEQGESAMAASSEALAEAEKQQLKGSALQEVHLSAVTACEIIGDFDQALGLIERCRSLAMKAKDPNKRLQQIDAALKHVHWSRKDYAASASVLRVMAERDKTLHGERSAERIARLLDLCDSELDAGQLPQAEADAREVIRLTEVEAQFRPQHAHAHVELASIQRTSGKNDEAVTAAERAHELAQALGSDSAMLRALEMLALCQQSASRYHEAIRSFHQHLDLNERTHANYRDAIEDLASLVQLHHQLHQPDEALRLALQLWSRIEANPESRSDTKYRADQATAILECYKLWRGANPTAPEPAELGAWRAAAQLLK